MEQILEISFKVLNDLTLVDPRIRQMFEYWSSSTPDDIPARAQVDPLIEIPELAPDLLMFNVVDGGADFMTRLSGTRVTERFGRETTGKTISTLLAGQYREALLTLLRRCVDERRPIYSLTNYLDPRRKYFMVERLMTPLRLHGDTVDMILALQLFHTEAEAMKAPLADIFDRGEADNITIEFIGYVV